MGSIPSRKPASNIWYHLGLSGTSGIIWKHLGASGSMWKHLAASGSTWRHLGWQRLAASGSIWEHLAAAGTIWHHLGSPTPIRPLVRINQTNKIILHETVNTNTFSDAENIKNQMFPEMFWKMV